MTKYTAKDFENARFAEHPDKALAVNWGGDSEWTVFDNEGFSGHIDAQGLADYGWVPVPTKPTITRSVKEHYLAGESAEFKWGFGTALALLDVEVIPDPEPTNTERLEQLLSSYDGYGVESTFGKLAAHLNKHGVTAPNVKGN